MSLANPSPLDCEVCCGDGRYPVITATGKQLYTIVCPECGGSGFNDSEEAREALFAELQVESTKRQYEALPRDPVTGRPVIG